MFYVDGMDSAAVSGAALETSMVEGQEHNVRYYSEASAATASSPQTHTTHALHTTTPNAAVH